MNRKEKRNKTKWLNSELRTHLKKKPKVKIEEDSVDNINKVRSWVIRQSSIINSLNSLKDVK